MRRFGLLLAGVLCLAVLAEATLAGSVFTVRENDDTLQSFDSGTLTFTDIGPLGTTFDFGGMTWEPESSTLYMVDGRGAKGLWTVNTTTGAASLVGIHGVTDLFGLAYDSLNEVFYATQFSGGSNLYTVNPSTGAATLVGNMGRGIGGLTYDSTRDQLVGIEDGAGDLYVINRGTAATTLLHADAFVNDSGLAYDPAADIFWEIDWNGSLFTYDPNSGYARTTELTGLGAHDGLAFVTTSIPAPVPEPSTIALFGIGALGAFLASRHRRRR